MASDLTIQEHTDFAAHSAREKEAERQFFDRAQPHFPLGFSINYRNPGHWDIYAKRCPGWASAWKHANPNGLTSETDHTQERAFCIRGEPGCVYVRDERWNPHQPRPRDGMTFRSVLAAMLWICEELMQEPEAQTNDQ